jgi:dTDP-L-rhamnose 4-epimerase
LATQTRADRSMYTIKKYTDINIKGASIFLDILAYQKNQTVEKIIIASSIFIYGEGKYQCVQHGIIYPKEKIITLVKNTIYNIDSETQVQSLLTLRF